jgi:A/G-specific adenine glycosylase
MNRRVPAKRARPISRAAFGRPLLAWFDAGRRDLPWRRTTDPYAVWVSEVMLQQTQAARVAEYWPRFLGRFPTVERLAEAALDDVLAAWSGLGYYRRARSLHEAARALVADRSGVLPATSGELRRLPGVGEYTAAAVASIAFGEVIPVLDANVARVLARVLALRTGPETSAGRRRLLAEAARLIDRKRPGDWNQSMMELGAVVCLPAAPRCPGCPVRAHCLGRRANPLLYPSPGRTEAAVEIAEAAALVVRGGRVLLASGDHPRGWWRGLRALPRCERSAGVDPAASLAGHVRASLGLSCRFDAPAVTMRYSVTRHRVVTLLFRASSVSGSLRRGAAAGWFDASSLEGVGVPAPDRRAIAMVLRAGDGATPRERMRR